MATSLCEEQFQCSICLHVFTEPVSTPCGHNYCKTCISGYWDSSSRAQCPLCNETFFRRPELRVNTGFRDLVEHFKKTGVRGLDEPPAKPGEVPCDVCPGRKLKALKSCLVCLASYCQTHLEPHQRVPALRRHKLVAPVENLEDRVCKVHNKVFMFFCRKDQMCVCALCLTDDHVYCETVPLEEELEERKAQLGRIRAEVNQMLQTKFRKIQEIKHSVELGNREAEEETADSIKVFSGLVDSIGNSQAELMDVVEEKQKAAEQQAEGFVKELQQEITELQRRSAELEQLSHTDDHLLLLQILPFLSMPPHSNQERTEISSPLSVGTVRRAVAPLQELLGKEMERVIREVRSGETLTTNKQMPSSLVEDELRRIQLYAVDVALDGETANHRLVLSDDRKQVRYTDKERYVLNSTKRFDCFLGVIGSEGFTSGRSYYEVQVKEKTAWTLGVARKSIYRKGWTLGLLTPEYGCWTVGLRDRDKFKAFTKTPVCLLGRPEKVGVFVDYEEGEVSFYDVEARRQIYSFTRCSFSEEIFPFFSPSGNADGRNAAPLIITPVS